MTQKPPEDERTFSTEVTRTIICYILLRFPSAALLQSFRTAATPALPATILYKTLMFPGFLTKSLPPQTRRRSKRSFLLPGTGALAISVEEVLDLGSDG